jgi:hypothetical protein
MYQVNGYADDFYTGHARNGRQVLMGLLCPQLVAYFFSPDGTLLNCETRPWNYPAPRMKGDGPYQIYDADFDRHLAEQMAGWQREVGFAPNVIRVEEFFDEAHFVGIKALPAPGEDSDWDEDEETLEAMREQGMYEFYWAKNYLMSADGRVDST